MIVGGTLCTFTAMIRVTRQWRAPQKPGAGVGRVWRIFAGGFFRQQRAVLHEAGSRGRMEIRLDRRNAHALCPRCANKQYLPQNERSVTENAN